MSNLTPEDVDLKLTSVHEKLNEEDMRLWEGLEDEKISRIAGDEANKKFTLQVQNENQGTESRLSTEVIHRSEGDLVNVGSLNALAQAMSEYRIKTDLELANEAIARQQLGVTLDTKINNFVASWDHTTMSIYSAIQAVQDDVTMKNYAMDMRIRKYEDMLQDITTDSIQITMDNGEINMGAWTILSQAREWDLEILGKFKDYKVQTDKDINDAIEDIQNQLPVKKEIIKEAIEALSNAPIIKELENEIGSLEVTIDGVSKTMMEHRIDVQNEMINLSKELGDKVTAETNARVDALNKETTDRINEIQKETAVRTEQFRQLDDGLTVEIQERIDGDNKAYELIENLKSSNETNLADVYQKIAVNTSDISANASKIEQVTAEVQVAQGDANQALVNAATALEQANSAATATNALAERVTQTETKLGEKVDAVVFNQTKSEVERIDGVTKAQGQEITTIKGNVETMDGVVKGHTTAIDAITSTQSAQGDKINQVTERTTVLEGKVSTLNSGLEANTTAVNNLKTEVDKNGQDIKTAADNTTKLTAKVDGLRSNGANLLRKSNKEVVWNPNDIKYPHGVYQVSEPWVEGETYTLTWCVTHEDSASSTGTALAVYAGGGLQQIQQIAHSGDRKVYVKQFVKDGQNLANAVVHFYLLNYNNDRNATATVHWAVLTRGPSIGVSYWEPCAADLEDGIANSASAEALSNLRAEVVAIDGRVTSTANDLTILKGTVDKNQADLVSNYYTKAQSDDATAGHIDSFSASLGIGGQNLITGTQTFDTSYNLKPNYNGLGTLYASEKLFGVNSIYLISGPWRGFYFSGFADNKISEDMVLSFWASSQDNSDIAVNGIVNGSGRIGTIKGAAWKQYSFLLPKGSLVANAGRQGVVEFTFANANNVLAYSSIQLQVGNKATDWSNSVDDFNIPIKANASAVSSISAQVSEIDGKVVSQASQIVTLTSKSMSSGINYCKRPISSLGNMSPGISGFTWEDTIVYDVNPGNGNWVSNWMASTDYLGVNNQYDHQYEVTTSMDIYFDDSPEGVMSNLVLPACYYNNGQGYLSFKYVIQPSVVAKRQWYRVFVTHTNKAPFNTINTDHLGVGACVGRLFVKNIKVEIGPHPTPYEGSAQQTSVKLQQVNEVQNGIKAVSTTSVNNNGFISGYGLISELVNGVVTSAFGVDADYFYVGKSMSNAKKPFMVLTSPQTIGGVSYPAGVWMDVAVIANATIDTAHIRDASITNAKIVDLNADKITAGTINADRIGANTITAEKLTIGAGTNLWPNPYFLSTGVKPAGRSGFIYNISELRGNGVQCYGRDHVSPWSTRFPVRGGEQFVIEYSAGHNSGPAVSTGVGLWYYGVDGGTVDLQYPPGENLGYIGNTGWHRKRAILTVPASAVNAVLFIQIEQSETSTNPMYYSVGDLAIRRVNGGELIVNGAITADKLYSNTVSGMFANFGEFRSTGADGSVSVMNSKGLTIIYPNGKTAIKIGIT